MRFRTRKDYNENDWAGQLFTIEKPHSKNPLLGGRAIRLFIWWKNDNPSIRFPFEIQWFSGEDPDDFHFIFPKRRKSW